MEDQNRHDKLNDIDSGAIGSKSNRDVTGSADEDHIEKDVDRFFRAAKIWLHEKSRKAGLHDWLMVIFTGILTLVASLQGCLVYQNSKSSTSQIDSIIRAANRIDDAADSFSGSATHINDGISDAVNKLKAQAEAIETARKSSEKESENALDTSVQNARTDLRAYIVVTLKREPVVPACFLTFAQQCVKFQYVNVGKTPAVNVHTDASLFIDGPMGNGDTVRNIPIQPYRGTQGGVLGNTEPGEGVATYANDRLDPCNSPHHGRCGHTIKGVIWYKDIFSEQHATGFCVYFPDSIPDGTPEYCANGNWFDAYPDSRTMAK